MLADGDDDDDDEMGEEGPSNSDESASSSDSEGANDDEDEASEADLELRSKIEEALRVNGVEPATGETDSEEEVVMDDQQMMAIDEQLAEVFRSRANEKKTGKSEFYGLFWLANKLTIY